MQTPPGKKRTLLVAKQLKARHFTNKIRKPRSHHHKSSSLSLHSRTQLLPFFFFFFLYSSPLFFLFAHVLTPSHPWNRRGTVRGFRWMGLKKSLLCHNYFMFMFIFMTLIPDLFSITPSGSSVTINEASGVDSFGYYQTKHRLRFNLRDIINPVTTVPTIIPAPYTGSASSSAAATPPPPSTPLIIPTSNPGTEVSPQTSAPDPVGYPSGSYAVANRPPSLSGSWCIASQGASRAMLQVGLDYACGYGRADCSAIQPGGRCYKPNSVRDHASYAFNEYYQKNPIPSSCNFGGTALVTSTDPSSSTCRYPSTSTSSSILNTTNSFGSRVFGAVPTGPTTSSSPTRMLVASAGLLRSFFIITTLRWLAQLCW